MNKSHGEAPEVVKFRRAYRYYAGTGAVPASLETASHGTDSASAIQLVLVRATLS